MQSGPRPFSWDRATLRGHDDSFGESPCRRGIDTFRNSTHHNGPMGSFWETVSRAVSPVFLTHHAEIPIGFVWSRSLARSNRYKLPLGSFGLGASRGSNRYRLPLGSSENRGRHDCNHANSAPPIFIGWGEHSDGHDCSFGLGASRGSNRYNLPLGSFGTGCHPTARDQERPLSLLQSRIGSRRNHPFYTWLLCHGAGRNGSSTHTIEAGATGFLAFFPDRPRGGSYEGIARSCRRVSTHHKTFCNRGLRCADPPYTCLCRLCYFST